jgi:solute:Na+ symporter, SSS family
MELALLDWVIVIGVLIGFLIIGLRYRKAGSKSLEFFFLGGRNLPWYIAGTSMVATTFAADTPLAVTELVQKNGISGNWLWWCFLTGGILTTFFFAPLWRRAGILTELELISIRYSGKPAFWLRIAKSIYMGVFLNAMIIGWVNLAYISLLQVFFDVSFNEAIAITFFTMLIAVTYSSLSGLLGVAITDVFQFIIAMVGCIVLAIVVVNSPEIGGISNLRANLPNEYFSFFPSLQSNNVTGSNLALSVGAFLSFFAVQWWASWYPGSEPGGGGYIAQRIMSTRSEKDSVLATLFFQVAHYSIRPWPWIIVALCAVYLYGGFYAETPPELIAEFTENPRLGYVFAMKQFLPTGLKGLLLVAFIAAYLSTISTQLNWGASFVVNDFAKPLNLLNKNEVLISRIVTLLLMLIGLFVTTVISSISGVWEFILNCGAGLGMVLILRWYWWRVNAWSEITAMLAPFLGYFISLNYIEPNMSIAYSNNNGTFLFTVLFTTVSWLAATYLTKPTEKSVLESFCFKVKPKGNWGEFGSSDNKLGYLFINWISAVVFVYASLFAVGYMLFGTANNILICLGLMITSGFILFRSISKNKLF